MSNHLFRLETMSSEFRFLKNKVSALKTTGLVYKRRFETKSSDFAKAEAEVCNLKHHIIVLFIFKNCVNFLEVNNSVRFLETMKTPKSCFLYFQNGFLTSIPSSIHYNGSFQESR
jgi:hypothetical protein